MTKSKPILCIDFDGVLHGYESGWQGAAVIPDPPVKDAMAFLTLATAHFRVAIFSSRSNQPGGIQAMQAWTLHHLIDMHSTTGQGSYIFKQIEWPTEKPPALVTLDDRALTFTGVWPPVAELLEFKPWNKK